jgi:hypothetical protein
MPEYKEGYTEDDYNRDGDDNGDAYDYNDDENYEPNDVPYIAITHDAFHEALMFVCMAYADHNVDVSESVEYIHLQDFIRDGVLRFLLRSNHCHYRVSEITDMFEYMRDHNIRPNVVYRV